jgi:peroxiredoxin
VKSSILTRAFLPAILALIVSLCLTGCGAGDIKRSSVSEGQQALAFHARSIDGKTINFPDDYKGRVVLLDFWATWCPPCREELPNVVAAYQQFHDKGFDVVSVSLDQADQQQALVDFTTKNHMTWPQIYDGQNWNAAVAVQYGVHAIPCPILVDGDTGKIIATEDHALGDNLVTALKSALASKGGK